ncbi:MULTISPECIES: hypothetical protein [Acinetobacter]|uniref:hypothetical protein n=1 Tax=Acinetobacter TaxID=469 RepID=UPI0009957CF2|nr:MULTISPECIES: hypothetical protein [Acinetobacter]OOW13393.1 hypothetical protein MF4640_09955 [Acinetobacter sp. MF4640]QQV08200.1 hypothetical protein I6I49_11715 [Acinetobacter johnsonii]
MHLDRQLQYEILRLSSEHYPDSIDDNDFPDDMETSSEGTNRKLFANLKYLEEYGLIKSGSFDTTLEGDYFIQSITITNKGLDLLADDGGLGAILNVVTVRFETETLRAILATKINQSELTPENKKSMIDALEELPAESIKHLTTKLLDECVDNLPAAVVLIGTWLGSF